MQCPLYEILPVKLGSGFYGRVTVEGKMYLGSTKSNKKEAKQSAAEKAVELHVFTSTPDSTVKPSELILNMFICSYAIFTTQVHKNLLLFLMYNN